MNKQTNIKHLRPLILILLLFSLRSENACAQWLCPWENRIPIKLASTSGSDLSDYQVRFDLTFQTGMNPDFSDIRFTASDGSTLLDFWVEQVVPSSSAIVWVKIPTIPSVNSTSVYLYFCNTAASSASDAANTFIFFDDFTTFSGWSTYGSGVISQDLTSIPGSALLAKTINCDPNGGFKLLNQTLNSFRLITREIRLNEGGSSCGLQRYGLENASFNGYTINRSADHNNTGRFGYERRNNGNGSNSNTTNLFQPRNNWYRTELRHCSANSNNMSATLYNDDRSVVGSTNGTDNTYSSFDRVIVHGGRPYYLDFMAVTKYTCSEPIHSFGDLEKDLPTAICQNNTVYLDTDGMVSISTATVDDGSFDECGIQSMTVSPNSFDCGDIGEQLVILTVTDLHNNTSTCSSKITIADNSPPSIQCPNNITLTANSSNCSAIATWAEPAINENCSLSQSGSDINSGASFPLGNTIVTYTASDNSGNTNSCTFSVTVLPPSMPLTIDLTDNSGNTNNDGSVCDGDMATLSASGTYSNYNWSTGANTQSISTATSGNYTVTATNSIGCTATASESITVLDRPTAGTCNLIHDYCEEGSGSITLEVNGGLAPYTFSWTPGVGTTTSNTINNSGEQATINNIPGATTISISVIDGNGCSVE